MKKIKEISKITLEMGTGLVIVPIFVLGCIGGVIYLYGKCITEIILENNNGKEKRKTIQTDRERL